MTLLLNRWVWLLCGTVSARPGMMMPFGLFLMLESAIRCRGDNVAFGSSGSAPAGSDEPSSLAVPELGCDGPATRTESAARMKRTEGIHLARYLFFFSSRRRHTRFDCDWSSDVCSSD